MKGIASIICPNAPFLVPLSLHLRRIVLQRATAVQIARNCRTIKSVHKPSKFLTKAKKFPQFDTKKSIPIVGDEQREILLQLRELIQLEDGRPVFKFYQSMANKRALRPLDTLGLAKVLQQWYRQNPGPSLLQKELLPFAKTLINDIRSGVIPPHCTAHLRLISFLKESKQFDDGYAFWTWIEPRGSDYVDAAVYGAAIELLAYQGATDISNLEKIYTKGLKRFPNSFSEYHLMPGAILSDRTQPVLLPGLSMSLLQGITTARMLHGDWRGAYQAFDTALRLLPTQVPPRIYELFLLERPVLEAYTIFMAACRSGIVLKPDRLTKIMNRLADLQPQCSLEARFTLLDRMINAMYAYAGVGGIIASPHMTTLVKGYTSLLAERYQTGMHDSYATSHLVPEAVRNLVREFSNCGITQTKATFGVMSRLATRAELRDLLESLAKGTTGLDMAFSLDVYRVLVSTVGRTEDFELVEMSWRLLVNESNTTGTPLDIKDWITLAKAGRRSQNKNFVQQQLDALGHATTDATIAKVTLELSKRETRIVDHGDAHAHSDTAYVSKRLADLNSHVLQVMDLVTSNTLHDFYKTPIPMYLDPTRHLGSEDMLRRIYDRLTTGPVQDARFEEEKDEAQTLAVAQSPTGIPFDELRFANWVTVNELLVEAEKQDSYKQKLVDDAVATGTPVPKKSLKEQVPAFLQSLLHHDKDAENSVSTSMSEAELQSRIIRLRRYTEPVM